MITLYHNPRCSKSREALALLESRGVATQVVEYLKTPPSVQELEAILAALKLPPRELMRKKEPEYKALGLDNPALNDKELIQAMAAHPVLIERPIAIHKGKAAVGRPPEKIFEVV
ncbi:MAG: arsC [Rickettsiales bacterium]|jgi:arsenate reductase|nr:arsC [Rickettsiales bacterium]